MFLLERPQEQSRVTTNIRVTQRVTRQPLGQHPHDNGSQAIMGIPRHHLVPQPEQSGVGGASGIATPHEVHDIISCAPFRPSRPLPDSLYGIPSSPLPDSLYGISIQSAPQAGVEGVQLGSTVVALQHGVQGQRLPKVTHPSTRTGPKHVLGKGREWGRIEGVGGRGRTEGVGVGVGGGGGGRAEAVGEKGRAEGGVRMEVVGERGRTEGGVRIERGRTEGGVRIERGRTEGGVRIERGRTEGVGKRGRMDGREKDGKGGCGNQVK